MKTEISYVGIALITFLLTSINCASLPTLEKQVVSDNDSIRVDAWKRFEKKLTTAQEYKVITHLITKAKYAEPHESLKAFEFLAHSGRSNVLVYGTKFIGCPSPDLVKRINKWDSKFKTLDDRSIDNYLYAIENGSRETKIFCISILGFARPIYHSIIDRLINILHADTCETMMKPGLLLEQNSINTSWMCQTAPYYAYNALKEMHMLRAVDAIEKYDSLYQDR